MLLMLRSRFVVTILVASTVALGSYEASGQAMAPHGVGAQSSDAPVPGTNLAEIKLLIDRGNPKEALVRLGALSAQTPKPEMVETLRGLAFYAMEDFLEADKAFATALQENPKDLEAVQMRGLTLFRLGKPAEAVPLLEAAHAWSSQTRVDPSYVLALCYLDTRQYDKARGAFAQQYGFPADSAQAYLLAARLLFRREYTPVAQQYGRKALELDPQLPQAHGLLGEIALAQQNIGDATKELELEKERNPLDGNVYFELGDAYSRAGNNVAAQQSLQRALLLIPNSTGPYIVLGKVLLKEQDPVNAVQYLERAEQMDPGNYRTHSLLGQAYRALGRAEDATRETATAQKIQAASEPKLQTVH